MAVKDESKQLFDQLFGATKDQLNREEAAAKKFTAAVANIRDAAMSAKQSLHEYVKVSRDTQAQVAKKLHLSRAELSVIINATDNDSSSEKDATIDQMEDVQSSESADDVSASDAASSDEVSASLEQTSDADVAVTGASVAEDGADSSSAAGGLGWFQR